jgi:hypothetical protein
MDAKKTFLEPNRGLGKELCDLLRETLAVPDGVRSVIRVECDYMPRVVDQPLAPREG